MHLAHQHQTHVEGLRGSYLWLAAITLTAGSGFSSPCLAFPTSPTSPRSSHSPFNYHLALRGVLKQARGARPSPFMPWIDILLKSDMRLSVPEEKLMADGCDGSWQGVTGVWLRVHRSLCLHEASTSVRRIRKDLLREAEESVLG